MIRIDKNVPLPPLQKPRQAKGREPIYPWRAMGVGDSFFTTTKNVANRISDMGNRLNMKFATETRLENGESGIRVWRVE